jgi:hypothetical protein
VFERVELGAELSDPIEASLRGLAVHRHRIVCQPLARIFAAMIMRCASDVP